MQPHVRAHRRARQVEDAPPIFDDTWTGPGRNPEDTASLRELWHLLSSTAAGERAAAADVWFRHDADKTADVAGYRIGLKRAFGPDADPTDLPALPFETAAAWSGGGLPTGDAWLWTRDPVPHTVAWRVYVNVVPAHAGAVLRHLAGVIAAERLPVTVKLGSPAIAATGRDALVCYCRGERERRRMVDVLADYVAAHPAAVARSTVRFAVRECWGVGSVADPPTWANWVDLAADWEETDAGERFRAEQGRSFRRYGAMSFTDVVVATLVACFADDVDAFCDGAESALVALGIDPVTGSVRPTPASVALLVDQLYE